MMVAVRRRRAQFRGCDALFARLGGGRGRFTGCAVIGLSVVLVAAGCRGGTITQASVEDTVTRFFDLAPMSADPLVRLTTFNGDVTVKAGAGDRADARVVRHGQAPSDSEAREALGQVQVAFELSGPDVVVTVTRSKEVTGRISNGADVEITVPARSVVAVTTSNGNVEVSGVENTASVETSNGNVTLAGGLHAVDVVSSNGTVSVDGAIGRVGVRTSNAAITLAATDAVVDAFTSNGPITFRGSLAGGDHRFETSNSPIHLALPGEAAFTIDADANSGKVACDFAVDNAASGDESSLVGSVGGGGGVRVTATTSNGDIRIEKAK
jgi:DUF4097 and DUF4098 domain-containing protein YvlB